METNKDIDYSALDYSIFRIPLRELESAVGAADNLKAANLQTQIASLGAQIAELGVQKANLLKKFGDQITKLEDQKKNLQKQVEAIEKKENEKKPNK